MSYQLIAEDERIARKAHQCVWCPEPIAKGERYYDERSKYEGDFQYHKWHPECRDALMARLKQQKGCYYDEGFAPHAQNRGSMEEA